jgi:TolB protein
MGLLCGLALLFTQEIRAVDVIITSELRGAEVIVLGQTDFPCTQGNPRLLPYNPGDVIAADLDFSRRFRMERAPELTPEAQERFAEAGALGYVRGEYTLVGENYTLRAELVDLESGEVIIRRNYEGPRAELRQAAHRFADELVHQLFGERGIAQTAIAYVNQREGAKEIWMMDYDGASARALTRNGTINLNPAFLGDRGKLIFSSYLVEPPQLYEIETASPSPRRIHPTRGMTTAPAYNPVDRELVFASTMDGRSELYRAPLAGGSPVRLTFSWTIETSPSWSPNGHEIAFLSDRSGRPMIYVMDRDGSNIRRITHDFQYCGSPAWSPRGDRIAFAAIDDGNNMNIYTIAPDGSAPVRLTSGGSNESPAWSPDGRFIAFSSTRTGSAEIYVMRSDGTGLRRLTFSGGNTMPAWSGF